MKTSIVIPTYNEKENIRILIPQIVEVFKQNGLSTGGKIVVVDDNSPDGTSEVVEEFMKGYKNVFLLKRNEKTGLGSAYIAGFEYALELGADIIFEMDGDCSHDPNDIGRFLDEFENGYDVIVGSRYIKESGIPKWSFYRRLISKCGNFFARTVAGIPIHDCTSGYRAIRASILKEIALDELSVDGYAFQISLLHDLVERNAKIKEIPITFRERWSGESKLGNGDIREFFITSFRLRLRRK
ncbi:MAG: polyprenol monophosphomannose synthase [Methanophagales archaeon]|nr:polyprenol monophosphomannose synthase [Methanophagales archaeon]